MARSETKNARFYSGIYIGKRQMDRALIKLYAGILKDKLEVHKQYTFNNEIYILLDAPIRGGNE